VKSGSARLRLCQRADPAPAHAQPPSSPPDCAFLCRCLVCYVPFVLLLMSVIGQVVLEDIISPDEQLVT